jgi:hypothetical protein
MGYARTCTVYVQCGMGAYTAVYSIDDALLQVYGFNPECSDEAKRNKREALRVDEFVISVVLDPSLHHPRAR